MKSILFVLICFLAVTASLSGMLMITHPDGSILQLPLSSLDQTLFKNFFIPGILLTVVVGFTNLAAVFFNLQRHANRYYWAMAGGFVICVWIILQIIFIQSIHWLHFMYFIAGLLVILIAYQLRGKWAV